MTWQDFWKAIKGALNYQSGSIEAAFKKDLTSEGGLVDQLVSGSLSDGYKDQGERAVGGVSSDGTGALEAYQSLVSSGAKIAPDVQEAFNNLMATESTNSARDFEEHMRDTDITSSASQLSSLGLSPAGLSGATAGHSGVSAASVGRGNPAQEAYSRKLGIAQSLIGLASGMASSGIYGASRLAVKRLAGNMALNAAHSGLKVSKYYDSSGVLRGTKEDSVEWNI